MFQSHGVVGLHGERRRSVPLFGATFSTRQVREIYYREEGSICLSMRISLSGS